MSREDARAVDPAVPRRGSRWRRTALLVALAAAVALTAAGIWLKVAATIHYAQPVPVPRQPRVNALVWSHRVFVDAATFKRWLDAHHVSFAAWERQHPRGLVVFHRRPTPHR